MTVTENPDAGAETTGKKLSEEHRRKISEALLRGNHRFPGRHLSEEHRRKISESNRRRKQSEETRRKISEGNRGKKLSEEHRRRISEHHKGMLGLKHSEETRRKIGEAHRGKKLSEETRRKISEVMRANGPSPKLLEHLRRLNEARVGTQYDMPPKKIQGIEAIVIKAMEVSELAQKAADDFDLLAYCVSEIGPSMKKLIVHALAKAYENKPCAVFTAHQALVRSLSQKSKVADDVLAAKEQEASNVTENEVPTEPLAMAQ